MKLAFTTAHYPYGNGEPFIEDELKYASSYFDEIIIFSLNKGVTKEVKYIPQNARVIPCRIKRFELKKLLVAGFKLFTPLTVKELYFSYKKLGFKNIISNLKKIYITYYIEALLSFEFKKEGLPKEEFLYYSYWLNESAFFLSELKKKHPEIKCISRAHGGDCFIERGYLPFRREVLEGLDEIHSISEAGAKSINNNLVSHTKGKIAEIKVSRLGIKKPNDALTASENKSGFYSIVTCSNIIELKRLDLIIEALALIEDININWVHFGIGELSSCIEGLAKEKLGDKPNIKYSFMGYCPKDKILEFYENNHIDLFVNCSDKEGIPVSVMEAMAYSIPVIARNIGGNGEIVNNDNGILLEPEISPADFKNAICKMLLLPENEINIKKQNAFNTFNNIYNAELNYKQFWSDLVNGK